MFSIKPIFLLIIVACLVFAYLGWKQQDKSLERLHALEDMGVNINSFLYSRPILAVDSGAEKIILVYPDKVIDLKFREIDYIRFVEAHYSSQESGNPIGDDKIRITLKNGKTFEVRGLQHTAQQTLKQLKPFLNDVQLDLKHRS